MELKYNHKGDDFIFNNYLPRSEDDFLYVSLAGYTSPRPTYIVNRKAKLEKNMYVLEYVLDGKGYIIYDGNKHTVGKGVFYMLNDSHSHSYFPDKEEPFEKLWINVYGSFMEKITEALQFEPITICKVDVLENFAAIHNILKGKNAYEVSEYTEQLSVEIFHLLYKVYNQLKIRKEHNDRFYMIKNYIRAHITDDISISRICEDNFVSKSTLYRMFKSEMNILPNEYIKKLKIDIASNILQKTNIDVHEIARQLGFYDYSHFSRVFLSIKKMTPTAYRKKHKIE